jgi:hypothetical protein
VSEIEWVAVAVYEERKHIGLLHKDEDEPDVVRLLHHRWQVPLEDTTDTSLCTFWVSPHIEPEQGQLVAACCRLIYSRNLRKVIPYGFGPSDGAFNESHMLSADAEIWGLTCSSFVLAVFHRSGIPLVDCGTWQVREEDSPTMEELIQRLRESRRATQEEIERQAKAIRNGQIRFRPLEVAAAASAKRHPVVFDEALLLAQALETECQRLLTKRQEERPYC